MGPEKSGPNPKMFDAAVDAIFADPHMAVDATYTPKVGAPRVVRAIFVRPDEGAALFDARAKVPTVSADVRMSEMNDPQEGEKLGDYTIKGFRRDSQRLVWKLALREA